MINIKLSSNLITMPTILQILAVIWISSSGKLSIAAKQNSNTCGNNNCDVGFRKFGYSNSIYKYKYSVDINTEFSGTGGNASSLYLQAYLDIFFPSSCNGFLRITDVKLWESKLEQVAKDEYKVQNSDEDDYYGEFSGSNHDEDSSSMHSESFKIANDLKKYLLRFSYYDGLITEICPSTAESVWTLNFKRGILSAFQNTMLRFDLDHNTTEIDVSGECNVKYSLEEANNVFIKIRKTKNIATCQTRYSTHSILQSTPYNFRDDKSVWSLLESKSHCDMIINNNLYQDITCDEHHKLTAFSNNNSGATTRVTSRLLLQGEEDYNREFSDKHEGHIEKRSTLIFDHTPLAKPTHSEIKLARDQLKDICSLGFPNIQREFLNVFTNFINTIKQLDYEALTQLLSRSAGICKEGKYHVLDSLPYIGSSASYQLMRDQLLTNSISRKMTLNWLKSMSFIKRPDEDTLETFYTIYEFSRGRAEPEYILSTSAVIHSYCRHNPDCAQNIRVRGITESIETEFINLFNSYRGERTLYKRMIVLIKSLGNIGILSDYFVEQLKIIITNEFAPIGIRLESIYVFRRADCIQNRSFFLSIYANFTTSSEVRIASYLQAMTCPDYYSVNKIKTILKIEEINQVGSFVWSHLKNLRRSSSPINVAVQSLLLDNDLSDKYNLDVRKFSRNYQLNTFFDEYNFGSTTDINVIFGTESFLPRMMTFNLTTHLFGHSINLIELTTRTEGFEHILTSILKTQNFWKDDSIFNLKDLKKMFYVFNNWLERKEESSCGKSINEYGSSIYQNLLTQKFSKNQTNNGEYGYNQCNKKFPSTMKDFTELKERLHKNIKAIGYKLKYDYDNPKIQFGFRIFGNDLHLFYLQGIPEIIEFAKDLDILQQIYEILSGKEVVYTKSQVFLEASYIVPLAIGLPLSVDIFGASAIDLRIRSQLEHIEPISPGWNFNIKSMIKPTLLIDVVGKMKTDLFYAQSGIKVITSLYSNSEVQGELKVHGQKLVSLSFSLPQNKSDILSIRSEILKIKRNTDEPQKGIESRRTNSLCTWSVLDAVIGLKACMHYSVPNLNSSRKSSYPGLLLSGPLNFNIFLAKSDHTAKNWTLEYTSVQKEDYTKRAFVFLTPRSLFRRLFVANMTTILENRNVSVLLIHGNNKALAMCRYISENNYRQIEFFLDTNAKRSLDLRLELKRQRDRNAWIYTPKMLLAINGVNITGAVGTIRVNEKNSIMQSDMDFSFETRKLQMLIRGIIVRSEVSKSANITINYRFQANQIESIQFKGHLIKSGDQFQIEYGGKMMLRTSAHPNLNFASNMTWRSLQGHTEAALAFDNPDDFGNSDSTSLIRLLLIRSYSEEKVSAGSRSHVSFAVLIPRSKIDAQILLKYEEQYKNSTEHNFIFGLRLNPEREATLLFSLKFPRKPFFNFDAFFNISITRFNPCFARLTFQEQIPQSYLIYFNGTWFTEQTVAIKANYRGYNTRIQALKMSMESPSFDTIYIYASYRRSADLTLANIDVKYGEDPYSLTVKANFHPDYNKSRIFEIHLHLKENIYYVTTSMLMMQPLTLQIEIHLDKLRDVLIKSSAIYLTDKKEFTLELNWDMNRDPSQRLLLLVEYNKPYKNRHSGKIVITHPEHTLSCSFNANTQGPKYYGDVYVSWEINELVIIKYDIGLISEKGINNWIHAEIQTPFNGWRKNSIDAGVYNVGNLFLANTSLVWGENQNIRLISKCDVNLEGTPLSLDVRFGLNSSLEETPSVYFELGLQKDDNKFVANIHFRHNSANETLKIYGFKSIWDFSINDNFKDVSGTVLIISPHKKFSRCNFVTKFSLKDHNEIRGAALFTYNLCEITLSMDAYVNRFNDNMVSVNITTPLSKLRNIYGRFGLIERKKHFVAEVQTPSSALGIEVLFDISSLTNFEIKFSVALPFQNLDHIALFTKLRSGSIDMRAKWNHATVGFIGVWYMNNMKDFEYSCQVFTPLTDFEENGLTVKFLKKDIFVLNFYFKLSRHSFGVKVEGKPKSPILTQFGNKIIQIETEYDDDFKLPPSDYSDLLNEQSEEFFSYNVDVLLDLLIWPTLEGTLGIEEIFDYYFAAASIKLPKGYIYIKNSLYYPDYLNIVNILNLQTPFELFKELKVVFEHRVDINLQNFFNKFYYILPATPAINPSNKVGCELSYSKISETITYPEHHINIILSLPNVETITVSGKMLLEDTLFKGLINANAGKTLLTITTVLEAEDYFFEGAADLLLQENSIAHYTCHAYVKQYLSKTDNSLNITLDIANKNKITKFQTRSTWQIENDNDEISFKGDISTNILPIKTFEYSFCMNKRDSPRLNLDLKLSNQREMQVHYGLRAEKKDEIVNFEIWTPMQNFKNISLHGTVKQKLLNKYELYGVLYRDMETYNVNGSFNMIDGYPEKTRLRIKSIPDRSVGLFELNIKHKNNLTNFEVEFKTTENINKFASTGSFFYNKAIGLEFSMLIRSSESEIRQFYIKNNLQFLENNRTVANFSLETPWHRMGLEKINFWSEVQRASNQGKLKGGYMIVSHEGNGNFEWSLIPEENIRILIEGHIIQPTVNSSYLYTELKYINPDKTFNELKVGGKIVLNTMWSFEINGTLNYLSTDDIQGGLITQWPTSNDDIHEIKCVYRGNIISEQGKNLDVFVEGKYHGKKKNKWYLSRVTYQNVTDIRGIGHVEWGVENNVTIYKTDIQILSKTKVRRELIAKIFTPKLDKTATLLFVGSYDQTKDSYHYVNCSIFYPFAYRAVDMQLAIQSFSNVNGYLNCTTPFLKAPWYKADFNFTTHGGNSCRFCQISWPTDFLFIRLHRNLTHDKISNDLEGNMVIELPLNTRHRADIILKLKEKSKLDKGDLKVFYNEEMVVNGTYQRKEYNSSTLKYITDITLENVFKPIALHFVNESDNRNKNKQLSMKRIDIYDLRNSAIFNLTFELNTIKSGDKKDIELKALSPNRTVIISISNGKLSSNTTYHRAKLALSKTAWVAYNIELGKEKTALYNNSDNFVFEISYPKRKLLMKGFYFITFNVLVSNVTFGLSDPVNNDTKSIQTSLLWQAEALGPDDLDNQTLVLTLGHNLLERDLTMKGSFYCGVRDLIKTSVLIEYSNNIDHSVIVRASFKDMRNNVDFARHALQFLARHKASEFNVLFDGSAAVRSSYFKVEYKSFYKKDFFLEKHGSLLGLVDLTNKEIEYMRKSPQQTVRLWMKQNMQYPVYGLNATLWNTPDTNNSGYIYIDMLKREIHMYFNLTEDDTENLTMFGCIPDARNSYMNIWRNYEQLTIVDVTSYLKLNHSRYISGRLHWRPDTKTELKAKIKIIKDALLYSFTESIDVLSKNLYVECTSALTNVWETWKEYNKDFLNDIAQISVLQEDLRDLQVFINKSYEANDFYLKSVLDFSLTVIDEEAFRDHIKSLPIIFSEIQQSLGESGEALRRSFAQFIELLKSACNNILNAINSFFRGEPLRYFTDLMEKGFGKYEKFMKEVHISVLNYIENIWNNFYYLISTYLKGLLQRTEPYIFKAMSFIEETVWYLTKELFKLIYERTNELAESTYFNQISSLTQDVENLYRDIKSQDAINNIKKYSAIIWKFIYEKYQKLVPFGSELNEVVQEIWHEVKELEKVRQIQTIIKKFKELSLNLEWIAVEIRATEHLHQLYLLLCNKLRYYSLNAIEVADMYREAKTKFLFDPEEGVIDFEQKLPMSWHSLNETPKFYEVSEYQMVHKIKNILTPNITPFLGRIYDLRSFLNPKTWFPLRNSRAFWLNSGFYVTFDKRFIDWNIRTFSNCSYILSHDFWNNSFTLSLDFEAMQSPKKSFAVAKFSLISGYNVLQIDLLTDTLTLNGDSNPLLPVMCDDWMVHREVDILSINSVHGYQIECNMAFGLCWFEVSGGYFGQTAGLLGISNNEPFDDFLTPSYTIANTNEEFINAWSTTCSQTDVLSPSKVITEKLTNICKQLFSSLTHCKNFVDPAPFMDICKKSGYKPDGEHFSDHLSIKEGCSAAMAYIEVCKLSKIPMRVPQQCVTCELANGTLVPEGTFVDYNNNIESRGSDFVFLLETKACNIRADGNKSLEAIVTALEEQLKRVKSINNRYAVVALGAQLQPFLISKGNKVFLHSVSELRRYIFHVINFINKEDVSTKDSDVLQAISIVSRLNFRPGVAKIFILFSCGQCNIMQFDYSSIMQYMKEEGITLHILTNEELDFNMSIESRHLFGFNKQFAFSSRFPEGDQEMRRGINISKSSWGLCMPLATETGGSFFSFKKMTPQRKNSLKRFATIFTRRVALSAVPSPSGNQTCECMGYKNGLAYMACALKKTPNEESDDTNDSDFSDWEWHLDDYDLA